MALRNHAWSLPAWIVTEATIGFHPWPPAAFCPVARAFCRRAVLAFHSGCAIDFLETGRKSGFSLLG